MQFQVFCRFVFIDVLAERGEFQRDNIASVCGVTVAQVSYDLKEFGRRWPDRIRFDRGKVRFMKVPGSKPVFEPSEHVSVVRLLREYRDMNPPVDALRGVEDAVCRG